jgi:hypothetical protein
MVSALARRQSTEVTMSNFRLAIAAACFALVPAAALAQEEPTYEGRGYGGPLGVGPNFQQGGQWGPPIYGAGREHSSTTERYSAPQHIDRAQRKRNDDDNDVKTAKKTPEPKDSKEATARSENSSIVSVGADTDKSTPVTEQKKADVANSDRSKSDKSKSSSENSTIASVGSNTTANADPVKGQLSKRVVTDASGNTVATCKRYFPTVGQTITVPCD